MTDDPHADELTPEDAVAGADGIPVELRELHPLVATSAAEPWSRADYAEAVRRAWYGLRDLLRDRLGEPQLDGSDLVNAIGEDKPPIRLPMTEYLTTTERNMHRGVVNFLRGVVYYVRNPDAHEGGAIDRSDRVGALERLAVMSLCARHVDTAAPPAAVEDAITELLQPRFPMDTESLRDLVSTIPLRRRAELASAVLKSARDADQSNDDDLVEKLSRFYPIIFSTSGWEESLLVDATRDLEALVANDATLGVAVMLMPLRVIPRFKMRNQTKVAKFLVEHAQTYDPSRRHSFGIETEYLYSDLPGDHKAEIANGLINLVAMSGDAALWASIRIYRIVNRNRRDPRFDELVSVIAEAAVAQPAVAQRLERNVGRARYGQTNTALAAALDSRVAPEALPEAAARLRETLLAAT
jgi:uncharacterized protein (TIGR02391 family)